MAETPIDLSFSRVQAYGRCPWLYHLVYNLGWRAGPTAGMAMGQSVHRALGRFLGKENTERTLDRLLEIFDEEWVNEGFGSPEETIAAYEGGRAMLTRFHQAEAERYGDVVATELDFNLPFGTEMRFRGTLDRLDKRGDVYEIVEYKTNADAWAPSRTESDLQMTLYALGMKSSLEGAPVRLRYHFLSNGESRVVERSVEQLGAAQALLADVGRRIKSKDFTPNHGHCARCEFARRCTNYQPAPSAAGEDQ